MFRSICLMVCATVAALFGTSRAQAWGAMRTGYTSVGPAGAYRYDSSDQDRYASYATYYGNSSYSARGGAGYDDQSRYASYAHYYGDSPYGTLGFSTASTYQAGVYRGR